LLCLSCNSEQQDTSELLGRSSIDKADTEGLNKDYKDLAVEVGKCSPEFQPRNQQQVKYFHAQARETHKIGRDAITNLHELAFMLTHFI